MHTRRPHFRAAEAPEWPPQLLDALRTPLEEGEIRLARAEGTVCYPARFAPSSPPEDRDAERDQHRQLYR